VENKYILDMANGTNKATAVVVSSFLGALVLLLFGDIMVYDPATLGENETGLGFETGSAGAQIVEIAPVILVAFGLYAGYRSM